MHKTDTPAPVGATVTEVLREELCSMEQREVENARHLEALRAALQLGAADIEAGRFKSFDTKASLREYPLACNALGRPVSKSSAQSVGHAIAPELFY